MTKQITGENFSLLLQHLSENQKESGEAYANLRNSLVRFFALKGDNNPDEAADETLDRVCLKLSQNGQIDNVTKFSFGVARLIFLERLRNFKKEKNAAEGFYAQRLLNESNSESDDYGMFRFCFDKLNIDEKNLLKDYFGDKAFSKNIENRTKLSEKYKISLNNLRVKVFRLRERLEICLKRKRENNF